mmetsp:Transcript_7723/g.17455  ORF Transcript_7723/g.17455 Transcript_7723/m.17455 type:complete len:114 (+) Transcript_7723:222-563(+)
MVEDFVDRVVSLLNDRSHGMLITVVHAFSSWRIMGRTIKVIVRATRRFAAGPLPCQIAVESTATEHHDAGGISNPFLQVQILTMLRLLGSNNVKASEEMNEGNIKKCGECNLV